MADREWIEMGNKTGGRKTDGERTVEFQVRAGRSLDLIRDSKDGEEENRITSRRNGRTENKNRGGGKGEESGLSEVKLRDYPGKKK